MRRREGIRRCGFGFLGVLSESFVFTSRPELFFVLPFVFRVFAVFRFPSIFSVFADADSYAV